MKNTRAIKIRGRKRIRKLREEKALLEDAQDKKKQQEDDTWKELEDYMASWDAEKRRTSTLST